MSGNNQRHTKRSKIKMGKGGKLQFVCLVLGFLLTFIRNASTLSITLERMECISETVFYEGDLVFGNFVVLDHDIFWSSEHPGIDFEVTSPTGITVHALRGTSGDKFQFKASKIGTYKFCFYSSFGTPETISFYIHVGHIPNEHDLAKGEHLDPVNVRIAELREALESITSEQKYLKARDTRHRDTNECTKRRLMYYTVAEYILLAASSAFQVMYIRRLFSKSIAYNRV